MFKQKMQNGKIKYGEWYIDPLTDKRKRVFVTIKSTGRKSDDRLAEDALKAKIRRLYSEADQPDAITLKDLKNKYVAYQQTHTKRQTAYAATIFFFKNFQKPVDITPILVYYIISNREQAATQHQRTGGKQL